MVLSAARNKRRCAEKTTRVLRPGHECLQCLCHNTQRLTTPVSDDTEVKKRLSKDSSDPTHEATALSHKSSLRKARSQAKFETRHSAAKGTGRSDRAVVTVHFRI